MTKETGAAIFVNSFRKDHEPWTHVPGTEVPITFDIHPSLTVWLRKLREEPGEKFYGIFITEKPQYVSHLDDPRHYRTRDVSGQFVNPEDLKTHVLWVSVRDRKGRPPVLTLSTSHGQDDFIIDRQWRRLEPNRRKNGLEDAITQSRRRFSGDRIKKISISAAELDPMKYAGEMPLRIDITQRPTLENPRPGNKRRIRHK